MKSDPPIRVGHQLVERRDLLKLLSFGGIASAAGLFGCTHTDSREATSAANGPAPRPLPVPAKDFVFLQLSDTHWGYRGDANPEGASTLRRAVEAINASSLEPDFVVFTGDLTHTTDDSAVRRARMKEFLSIVDGLKVKTRHFIPGEHDAGPDGGEAYREIFGETHASFDHQGVHFALLDNVSLPGSRIGDAQIEWLANDLAHVDTSTPLVVLAHRPLFELFPAWDWTTADGDRALALIQKHPRSSVFYGHIHQEHHFTTGSVQHHAARSLIFPLPAPGSVPKKAPLPWDPAATDHGIGYRSIDGTELAAHEIALPIASAS